VGRARAYRGVIYHSLITIADHGKSVADGFGSTMKNNVFNASTYFHHLDAGTRSVVLYLAQHHPTPKAADSGGRWSPQRYFYGYYNDVLAKTPTKYYKTYEKSKSYHYRAGFSANAEEVDKRGPVTVKPYFCACPSCVLPVCQFGECKVPSITGSKKVFDCPPVKAVSGVSTRSQSLADFSKTLKKGQFLAARVAPDQIHLEGPYWLAKITGDVERTTENIVHSGEELPAGSWVVKGQWFEFVNEAHLNNSQFRVYQPEPGGERLLSTNIFFRERTLAIEKEKDRSNKATGKVLLNEWEQNSIEEWLL
jgi:hypothetical protein